jgi:hypothetical protein
MAMISVTPIDEMEGDKHVVHSAVLINTMVIRKIETVEIAPLAPTVPKVEGGAKEPIAAPVTAVLQPVAPVLLSMITFIDGKTMHVKEDMATIKPMVA